MGSDTNSDHAPKQRRPLRLRTILLVINLLVLLLPVGGIAVLRLYENQLVRRTEKELVTQGAFAAATYKHNLFAALKKAKISPDTYGVRAQKPWRAQLLSQHPLRFIPARLDIATDPVYPKAPPPRNAQKPADRHARNAGNNLSPIMREAQRTTLAGIRIVDAHGVVVSSTRGELQKSLHHRPEVRRVLRGEHVSILRTRVSDEPTPSIHSVSRGARVRVFVAIPIVHKDRVLGAVILSRTPVDVIKSLYNNRRHLFLGATVSTFVVLLLSLFTSTTLRRPVRDLIRQVQAIQSGQVSRTQPLKNPGTYEFALLSEALCEMASILAFRADYIETFASNVSHEFKTPLTSLRGTVELLRDHIDDMTADERERFLSILDADTERLDRLVGRLLDLARADVFEPTEASIPALPTLQQLTKRFQDDNTALSFTHSLQDQHHIHMEREIFESILSNLIDNARQHNPPNVHITLQAHPHDKHLSIHLQDNGDGISPNNLKRVFTPFFTTARDSGGSGLGLSIVRSLITAHHGTIELTSTPEHGTSFSITLPLSHHTPNTP